MLTGKETQISRAVSSGQGRAATSPRSSASASTCFAADDEAQRRRQAACSTSTSSSSTRTASTLRGEGPRDRLGRDRARIGPDAARPSRRRRRSTSRPSASIGIYGMGLTQHVHGFENVAHAGQPAAAARQYRPRRRGHLAGARPFQRAGPAHRRHHREARAGAARQARGAVRLRAAAREGHEHGRGLRGHHRGQGQGLHRARRQFRARHPRARADGGGLDRRCA